jgi:hypothetical protein
MPSSLSAVTARKDSEPNFHPSPLPQITAVMQFAGTIVFDGSGSERLQEIAEPDAETHKKCYFIFIAYPMKLLLGEPV